MNRLDPVIPNRSQESALRGDRVPPETQHGLQWTQSIGEQLGDGYLLFSRWQCLGLGGRLWRDPESGNLNRSIGDDWLGVFHEDDHGIVALGLADPTVNSFPLVQVYDAQFGGFRKARLRVFYPPFEGVDDVFAVVVQIQEETTATGASPAPKATPARPHVFEATSAEMLIVEPATGLIIAANEAFLSRNGLEHDSVAGKLFEDLPVLDSEVGRILLGTLELGGQLKRRPLVLMPEDAEPREMLVDAADLDEDGTRVVLHFVDVTLHNSATRHLSSILNHLPIGIFTKCPQERTYLLSNVTADHYLAEGEALRGRHDEELLPAELVTQFAEADERVIREGTCTQTSEVVFHGENGNGRRFHVLRVPIKDSCGNITRILGMMREVTADVQSREALCRAKEIADRANQAKSEFLVNMGHEIRTPMNAILGFLNLLAETELDGEQKELLEEVRHSGEMLSSTVDKILDLSRLAGGTLALEPQEFDLEGLCEELVDSFGSLAREKGLELRLIFDPSTPARVQGDPFLLRQLLGNLVDNAVKFTDRGLIEISAETLRVESRSVALRLAVADTGIGVAPEKQSSIFEPFVQADSSETRAYEGTGLGLTLSQRLAEAMGGQIRLESEPGLGSTFFLDLKLEHDGSGSVVDLEPCPEETHLEVYSHHPERGASLVRPLVLWGMQPHIAPSFSEFAQRLQDESTVGFALVEWSALRAVEHEEWFRLVKATNGRVRWLVAANQPETAQCMALQAPHVRVIESALRSSVLRAALAELSDQGAVQALPPVPAPACEVVTCATAPCPPKPRAGAERRLLILDDEGMHRRQLVRMLQDADVVVDTCDSEHVALEHLRLHAYDGVFFETNFLGDETARLVSGMCDLAANAPRSTRFYGLAYMRSERREAELRELGVRGFLGKPLSRESLEAVLESLAEDGMEG